MKQYKHIPTGRIYEDNGREQLTYKEGGLLSSVIPIWVVTNSKDWEEILPWTILSFVHPASNNKWTLNTTGDYKWDGFARNSLDYMLRSVVYKIHSVYRKRDKEIFTIADDVEVLGKQSTITKIDINPSHDNEIRLHLQDGRFLDMDMFTKSKPKKLLTTEDGVDIFDRNQTVYGINQFYRTGEYKACSLASADTWHWFSTKEKAKEYLEWNIPSLSLKDINDNWVLHSFGFREAGQRHVHGSQTLDKLRELVKSRI